MAKWTDTGEMTLWQALDIPPVWLFGLLVLGWLSTQWLPALTYPHTLTRAMGGALVLGGLALMIWAIRAFRVHQTSVVPHQMPQRLITTGPFARSRNPIYLGDVMILTGALMWWGAWPALLLIPVFVVILTRRFIAPEEVRMKQNFGPEFEEFAERTPRWL